MRIDKFLKVSRILKRRSVSKEACDTNRIFVNGKPAKPSYRVKIGEVITLNTLNGEIKFKVKDLNEHVRKEQAETLYEVLGE